MANNTAANNWAIVVGVNDYDFLPEASLRFAVKDALAMKAFLCEEAGFPEKQVLLCGDGSSGTRKATRPILRDILLHQIQHARNADNLWFFFSGHGLGEHLMPIDGNPNDLQDTAISIHFVTERLRACKAKNIVLVLDMCRNEHHDVGQKSAVSVADALKKLVQDREGQQGIITLFSCGRGESSYEIASLEQGAFTHALLEGLKQQTILKELETYLARRVPELHSVNGKTQKQVPLVIPEPGWKYDEPILSHYATAIDVVQLKEMAIDAESDGETHKAIRLWEQVNLLAEKGADRQRALNRIRVLMAQLAQFQTVSPVSTERGTVIPKAQDEIDWSLAGGTAAIETPNWNLDKPKVQDEIDWSLAAIETPDWNLEADESGTTSSRSKTLWWKSLFAETKDNTGPHLISQHRSSRVFMVPYNSREALVRWEIEALTRKHIISDRNNGLVLRLYDVTGTNPKDVLLLTFEQWEVDKTAQEQRILMPSRDYRDYMIIMGYLNCSGDFLEVSRSDPTPFPSKSP
jgi:Caspase domain/Domain of unknown function (DUF4912)